MIYNISPTQTPLLNMAAKGKATSTLHEWQTQDLATAANNAQIQGDDATAKVVTPTVRLNNRTQISSKTAIVTGTQEQMVSAGRKSEMAYQMALISKEIKRDMEVALCNNTTAIAGNATTAPQLRGLEGWVATNGSLGASGVAPNYITNTAPTDGTARAFTESQLKTVLQLAYNEGGDPDTLMLGGLQKQTFSAFTGGATRFDKAEDKSVTAAVDIYVSDFGELKATPNRFQRNRTAFVLQSDKWAVCYLRPFFTQDLAVTGDSLKKQMIVEYTLESRQEKSGGVIRDLT